MTRPSQPFLWFLLAAALFMRAVLPQGYMPERSDSGSIAVVVCGSGAIHRIPLADGSGREKEQQQRAEPPCAFAGLGTATVPPPAVPDFMAPAPTALAFAERPLPPRPAAAPRLMPPARGPPLPA